MTFAEDRRVWRGLGSGAWGSTQLIVGGKDVTTFEGAPTETTGYQLTEPWGFGPANFRFPTIGILREIGTSPLAWLDVDKRVYLYRVRPDTTRELLWAGQVDNPARSDESLEIECSGRASGTLALRDKQPELIYFRKDAGILVADILRQAGLTPTPSLGPTTGIVLSEQGRDSGTFLDYAEQILAEAQKLNGDQLTVMPNADATSWRIAKKDRVTVDFTVFLGADGVQSDLRTEVPDNAIYGYGRRPAGGPRGGERWGNDTFPGMVQQESPPTFPGTLTTGDTGDDVAVLESKLSRMGYLDRVETFGDNTYDAETATAVRKVQRRAGLSVTGTVNAATWNAVFNPEVTQFSLVGAHRQPLYADPAVIRNLEDATGNYIGPNPDYVVGKRQRDRTVDFGVCYQGRAEDWAEAEVSRGIDEEMVSGVVTLTSDVWVGDVTYAEVDAGTATAMGRGSIKAGMNFRAVGYNGGAPLLHVSGVDVSGDMQVRLASDSHARDLPTLGADLERRRNARSNPRKSFVQERRRGGVSDVIESTEHFGWLYERVVCEGGKWTVIPVLAGQSGSINRVHIEFASAIEFSALVAAKRVTRAWCHNVNANPLTSESWLTDKAFDAYARKKIILDAWGDADEPAGYGKRLKSAGGTKNGVLVSTGGLDYWTFDQPVLYVAVYPEVTATLNPQRLLWPVLEAGT